MRTLNTNATHTLFPVCMLLALFLSVSIHGMAQQVKSDYEIQQEFKEEYKKIRNSLAEADSSAAVLKLMEEVQTLEETYANHEELLDQALYPDSFNEKMELLKRRTLATNYYLATIERQDQKLQELSQQLTLYDSRMENLNSRTDSLRNAIRKSAKSEKKLSGIVSQYRESLKQRDDLILSFVDLMMANYQKLSADLTQDSENALKKARFNAEGNALKTILAIANENISLLDSNPDLTTEEYLRLSSVQQEFKRMWEKAGDKLIDIYAEGNKKEIRKNISDAIATWNEKANAQIWASLNNSFDKAGIQLPKFTDRETFYQTLNSYLSESIKAGKKDASGQKMQNFRDFSSFWTNRVQAEWTPYMMDAEVLSARQMASIDQQVEQWATAAKPESKNIMLAYLLGISVLAIVALGVMLAKEKKNKQA